MTVAVEKTLAVSVTEPDRNSRTDKFAAKKSQSVQILTTEEPIMTLNRQDDEKVHSKNSQVVTVAPDKDSNANEVVKKQEHHQQKVDTGENPLACIDYACDAILSVFSAFGGADENPTNREVNITPIKENLPTNREVNITPIKRISKTPKKVIIATDHDENKVSKNELEATTDSTEEKIHGEKNEKKPAPTSQSKNEVSKQEKKTKKKILKILKRKIMKKIKKNKKGGQQVAPVTEDVSMDVRATSKAPEQQEDPIDLNDNKSSEKEGKGLTITEDKKRGGQQILEDVSMDVRATSKAPKQQEDPIDLNDKKSSEKEGKGVTITEDKKRGGQQILEDVSMDVRATSKAPEQQEDPIDSNDKKSSEKEGGVSEYNDSKIKDELPSEAIPEPKKETFAHSPPSPGRSSAAPTFSVGLDTVLDQAEKFIINNLNNIVQPRSESERLLAASEQQSPPDSDSDSDSGNEPTGAENDLELGRGGEAAASAGRYRVVKDLNKMWETKEEVVDELNEMWKESEYDLVRAISDNLSFDGAEEETAAQEDDMFARYERIVAIEEQLGAFQPQVVAAA